MVEMVKGILLVSLLLVLLISFVTRYRINSIIKSDHKQLWKDLGEPRLFSNTQNLGGSTRFYWKKEYLKTNDARLIRLCKVARVVGFLYPVVFVALIVVLFKY